MRAVGFPRIGNLLLPVVALVALGTALAPVGCSRPEVRYQRTGFPFRELLTERVAVGGFVLGVRAGEDQTAQEPGADSSPATVRQSWQWAPRLEAQLLVQAPELDRWSFASVADQIEPERLAAFLDLVARGSIPTAAQLGSVAADLPGVRFLLLARLDRNELALQTQVPAGEPVEQNPSGLGKPGQDTEARALDRARRYVRREIAVELELYDLQSGGSIWSASVEGNDNRLLDNENGGLPPRLKLEKDPSAEGGVRFSGTGGLTGGPELDGLLDEACGKLVAELMALARPADEIPTGR